MQPSHLRYAIFIDPLQLLVLVPAATIQLLIVCNNLSIKNYSDRRRSNSKPSKATVCRVPQATLDTFASALVSPKYVTACGVAITETSTDKPNCPLPFHPHVYKSPALLIAQLCQPPAAIDWIGIPARASTSFGSDSLSRSP